MTEYYRCDKCLGLKIKTTNEWQEFGIRDNCKHTFKYSNVVRSIYKEKGGLKNDRRTNKI